MLLEKLSNYIDEVEKEEKIWESILMPNITMEELIEMEPEEREEIKKILSNDMLEELIKLEEGGLI